MISRLSRLQERADLLQRALQVEDDPWRRESLMKALERVRYFIANPELDGGRLPYFEPWAVRDRNAIQRDILRELGARPSYRVRGEPYRTPEQREFWLRYSAPRAKSRNWPGHYFIDVRQYQLERGCTFVVVLGAHDHAFFIPREDLWAMLQPMGKLHRYTINITAQDEDPRSGSFRYFLMPGNGDKYDISGYWLRYDLLTGERYYIRPWRFLFEGEEHLYDEPYHCGKCNQPLHKPSGPEVWAYAVYEALTEEVPILLCSNCRRHFGLLRNVTVVPGRGMVATLLQPS